MSLDDMRVIEKLTIKNFKSIREQSLNLERLNVFIGGNGAGKSNLIEVFKFLREIFEQNLGTYTAQKGGANALLHFGQKHSKFIELQLEFSERHVSNGYRIQLLPTVEDTLAVGEESVFFHDRSRGFEQPYAIVIGRGKTEASIKGCTEQIAAHVRSDLASYQVYHFHDTSETAKVKLTSDINDNRALRANAENLASFLYFLQEKHPTHFASIQDTVRQIAPFFERFNLAPALLNSEKIRLEWKEKGNDTYFNAGSLSDGTLRFICLATLLLQPHLPGMILLDEPELGLHPAAVSLLADLLTSAATHTQLVVATQSVTLINQFEPQQVWAVDRAEGASVFHHLSTKDMENWLEDYALGELWEKNILGARP